ncbi:MAG: hypothetical protein JRD89_12240 [Deltaproteobacteria bacterium]|nr:hypothetical protein [Deltaproteobacteria bacterium]
MAERNVSQWAVKEAEALGVDIDLVPANEDGGVNKQAVIDYAEGQAPPQQAPPADPLSPEPTETATGVEPEPELTPEQAAVKAEADALQAVKDGEAAVIVLKEKYAEAVRETAKFQKPATFEQVIQCMKTQQRKKADGN